MKPNTLIDDVPSIPLQGSRLLDLLMGFLCAILCALTFVINAFVEHNYLCLIKAYLQKKTYAFSIQRHCEMENSAFSLFSQAVVKAK